VVTICLTASAEETRTALQGANADVLALLDEDSETMWPYHVSGTPTTYLVDGTGVIQMYDTGYESGTRARLQAEIERLLEE
jgi:hypothetical protein